MKFTKEEAREKITAAFSKEVEKIADWERTIKENTETLFSFLGEESEIELETFVGKAVELLKTQKGHINKATSVAVDSIKTQLEELKSKQPKKNEKSGEEENTLEERIRLLEQQLSQEKAEKAVSLKKSELKAKIKEKGVENDEWIDAMLEKASITETTDIESEAESYLGIFNKFAAKTKPSTTPKPPAPGDVSEAIKNIIKGAGEMVKNNG